MPFIPNPRYSTDKEKSLEPQRHLHEDISMTWRKPYPQEHEIRLTRNKMI
jgi:DNA polymerase-3 subunit alpha